MKALFILGSLNAPTAWWLATLEIDHIYHFSAQELSLPGFPIPCLRLANPQVNALKESAIVESCIDRNIVYVTGLDCDISLMRRALRLSELRVEARSYLNVIELIRRQTNSNVEPIKSLTIVSHYLVAADTSEFFSSVRTDWLHVSHTRFLGLIPGLNRLIFQLAIILRRFRLGVR